MSELAALTAVEIEAGYRRGKFSPVEVAAAVVDRAEALNAKVNAFVLLDREAAVAAARQSETRWRNGAPLSPLDGVPVSIKDLLLTNGWPTLRGSKLIEREQPWTEDAPVVARLREAGAVLFGKTTTPEFGWKALGDSPLTGVTRNPWKLDHTPGGSSAGAAAGLAAGIGPLAVGTDGGGSIRIPGSFSGVFGLKPTFGRVAAYPPNPFGTVAHIGPMARSVTDAARMLTVMSGFDDRDPWSVPAERRDFAAGIDAGAAGLRIGYSPALGYARVDPEVRAAVDRAAEAFSALGAHVEAAEPDFANPRDAFMTLWTTGAARLLSGFAPSALAQVDPGLVSSAKFGAGKTALDYLAADAVRSETAQAMIRFHRRYDLLLTPTVAVPALPVGYDLHDPANETHWIDWTPFSYPFNLTRQPAATVPCGLTRSGLPIGFQLVGRHHDEGTVLRAARAYEAGQPWRQIAPV